MRIPEEVQQTLDDVRYGEGGVSRALLGSAEAPWGYIVSLRYYRSSAAHDLDELTDPQMHEGPVHHDAISVDEFLAWAAWSFPYDVFFGIFGDSERKITFVFPHLVTEGRGAVVIIKNEFRDEFLNQLQKALLAASLWRRTHGATVRNDDFVEPGRLMKLGCKRGRHPLLDPQEVPGDMTYQRCSCGTREVLREL